jgi:TolB-like protein
MVLVGGTAGALALAAGVWMALSGGSANAALAVDPLARKIAVRYFTVDGAKGAELQPTAERLTESLIRELSSIRELRVVSANGVAPFRNRDIARDSVAKALEVGTIIDGTVEREGGNARVSVRLYDAGGGNLGDPVTVTVPIDSLFQAEESVATDVSAALKERIGGEFEVREARAGTRSSAAWDLISRAELARKNAAAFGVASADSALARLTTADSLLRDAARADARWIEPPLQRVQVALDARRYLPEALRPAQLDSAMSRLTDALNVDPRSAKALELRGTIKYERWKAGRLTLDPQERALLLTQAEDDLQKAVQQDGSLVTAYATLAFLYYDKKDVPASLNQARIAYQADAFLANSAAILNRLFFSSYDTEQFAEARKWCDEGSRRFPRSFIFTQCKLWLMLEPSATPDIETAWQHAAAIDTLAPVALRPYQSLLARILVGGAIGRYATTLASGAQRDAMLDSARRVLDRAQGDRKVDPEQELPGYRAVMLAQFGDYDKAIQLLNAYVAANPDHSFNVGGNVHWWWRDIKNERGFKPLLARTR